MIGTNDLDRARGFYDALLATLGVPPSMTNGERIFYMTPTGVFSVSKPINGEPATFANGGTVGFACSSPEQADAWHAAGIAAGLGASWVRQRSSRRRSLAAAAETADAPAALSPVRRSRSREPRSSPPPTARSRSRCCRRRFSTKPWTSTSEKRWWRRLRLRPVRVA